MTDEEREGELTVIGQALEVIDDGGAVVGVTVSGMPSPDLPKPHWVNVVSHNISSPLLVAAVRSALQARHDALQQSGGNDGS